MTALVVKFKAQQVGSGGGVQARRKQRDEPMEGEGDHASQPDDERIDTNNNDNDDEENKNETPSQNQQEGDQEADPKPIEL